MRQLIFILLLFLVAGCSKNNTNTPGNSNSGGSSNTNQPDTTQYGTPFKDVPDSRDAVIYQVNMRCFSAAGNFQGVIDRLDSIKALGVNVVYLMPIYPVGQVKSINSPYCIKNDIEVGSEFGTLTDLRTLVSDAHKLGMAVILDWITDGTSWDCSWIQDHPSWYVTVGGNIQSPNNYNDIAELNYQNQEMRDTIVRNMIYWVKNANIDGFRCDYADFAPSDFWKQAITALKKVKPAHKYILLAEGTRSLNYASGFDYNFGFDFYGALKSIYGKDQSVQLIDDANSREYLGVVSDTNQIVRYLTNHDVNSSDGTPLDLFGGKKGSMAAFIVVAYMKGVPFIYNGQEVATSYRLTFPFTSRKIDWSVNPDVTAQYKQVIAFRNKNAAVRRGKLTSYDDYDVCAFTKILDNDTVIVIDNLRNKVVNFTLPAKLSNSTWSDVFSNTTVSLGTQVTLKAYSYMVLENK